jgi:hypothetical protein
MDPYLEQHGVWNQVHTDLIVAIRQFLAPLLQPHYNVLIEQMTYLSLTSPNGDTLPMPTGQPDALLISPKEHQLATARGAAHTVVVTPVPAILPMPTQQVHRYVEIRDRANQVITVIKILSPVNKTGRGREEYLHKRHNILASLTHLVEIDLLRRGKPLPMEIAVEERDYRIVVSRSENRPMAEVYLFGIREPIPDVSIPLREGEAAVTLTLNRLLHQVYELGYYANFADYHQPLIPALSNDDLAWVRELTTGV